MFSKKWLLALLVGLFPASAWCGADVADVARFEIFSQRVDVRAGKFVTVPLDARPGDVLEVEVSVLNRKFDDMNVYLCSENGIRKFQANRRNDCRGVNRGRGRIRFSQRVDVAGPHKLLLDNSFSLLLTKKTNVRVNVIRPLPSEVRVDLQNTLGKLSSFIQTNFDAPAFDINLKPCGQENAYSDSRSGDITVCSELFFELAGKKLNGAIAAIVYHELARSIHDAGRRC